MGQVTAVVRVGGGARSGHPHDPPGDKGVRLGSADAFLRPVAVYGYLAWAHQAMAAAHTHLAEAALGLLRLVTAPRCGGGIFANFVHYAFNRFVSGLVLWRWWHFLTSNVLFPHGPLS
jgi:hypothetical protein